LSKEEQNKRNCLFLSALVASGYSCVYKGAYHYQAEEPIRGSYYLKKAWEAFSRADKFIQEQKGKTQFDTAMVGLAGFGVAIFQFAMSLIPPVFQTIGQLVGFEANRQNAIKLFKATYTSGCPKSIEAGIILVVIHHFLLDEATEAKALLNHLMNGYPDSVVLLIVSSYLSRFEGDLTTALEGHHKVLEFHEERENTRPISGLQRDIGTCHWLKNDFAAAIPYFEKFLATPIEISKKNYRPTVAFNLGLCYWMVTQNTGNQDLVAKIASLYSKAIKEWIRDDESYDLIAKRKMEAFLSKKKFSDEEIIVERLNALIEGKQWDQAREVVEQLVPFQTANSGRRELFALYFYVLGRCDHGKKDYDSARDNLQKAIAEDGKISQYTWIVPFALFAMGQLAIDQKQWKESLGFFDRVSKYKEYDWERLLVTLIYVNKQTVEPHLQK